MFSKIFKDSSLMITIYIMMNFFRINYIKVVEDIDWVQEVNFVKIANKSRSLKRKKVQKDKQFFDSKDESDRKRPRTVQFTWHPNIRSLDLCKQENISRQEMQHHENMEIHNQINSFIVMEKNLDEEESQVNHVVLENEHGKFITISSLSKLDDLSFLSKQSSLELAHSSNTQFTYLGSVKNENTGPAIDMKYRFSKEAFEDSRNIN
ncbi:hypothetical protein LIER_27985 [Lithospermum erythrorhizon]|uniref:Ycf1 n=1 Tax=Lithospermum erythrorhizon TaxID=34254 RepID=A0AAV3RG16_LITER